MPRFCIKLYQFENLIEELKKESDKMFKKYKEDVMGNDFYLGYSEGIDYAINKLEEFFKEVEEKLAKFRRKPLVVEAIQYYKDKIHDVMNFVEEHGGVHNSEVLRIDPEDNELYVKTKEGWLKASEGDWIICGIQKEFYPCKPDIFQEIYEPVDPWE